MPLKRTEPKGYAQASTLRKNLTPSERRLWGYLQNIQIVGTHFRRQHAIGPYVVDFCDVKHKLVIEVDGSQHLDQEEYDKERTEFLNSWGYRVVRFWNNDIMNNIQGVLQAIGDEIQKE